MKTRKLNRREFLKGVGLASVGLGLAAAGCQPKTVVVEKEGEKKAICSGSICHIN